MKKLTVCSGNTWLRRVWDVERHRGALRRLVTLDLIATDSQDCQQSTHSPQIIDLVSLLPSIPRATPLSHT